MTKIMFPYKGGSVCSVFFFFFINKSRAQKERYWSRCMYLSNDEAENLNSIKVAFICYSKMPIVEFRYVSWHGGIAYSSGVAKHNL